MSWTIRLISVADMISSSFVSGFRTQNIESVYFDFWSQAPVAAGMPPCKQGNRTACDSSVEYRGRVLHGNDRSAKPGLSPNCFAQAIRTKNGRPSHTSPGERPTMLDLRLETRQPADVFSNRNGSWALLKKHIFPV